MAKVLREKHSRFLIWSPLQKFSLSNLCLQKLLYFYIIFLQIFSCELQYLYASMKVFPLGVQYMVILQEQKRLFGITLLKYCLCYIEALFKNIFVTLPIMHTLHITHNNCNECSYFIQYNDFL